MSEFDDRWRHVAALAGTSPMASIPEPPCHLAAHLELSHTHAIIRWPIAAALAASLYMMMLPLVPSARTALAAGFKDTWSTSTWLPCMPSFPNIPSLVPMTSRNHDGT